jgi:DNA sulfur modification protein DndE
MFTQIRTSTKNRDVVTFLTRKFGLGAENIIARIAIAYSLQQGNKFSPLSIQDSGGKEYSKNVLFGSLYPIYAAMMCKYYDIKMSDKDLPRYFKIHLDDGLGLIMAEVKDNPNLIGFDYIFDKIKVGLEGIC